MTEQDRVSIVAYRIERAKATVAEVRDIVELGHYNTAMNRLYYACFYAAIALLIKHKIEARTHSGVRRMLGLHFVKTGKVSEADSDL